MFRSLSVRLSLTYAACCLVSMAAVLLICYVFLSASLRRQTDAGLASEIPEYRALLESQDLTVLQDAVQQEALSEGADQVFFRILDGAGTTVFATNMTSWTEPVQDPAAIQAALNGKLVFADYHDHSRQFHARLIYGRIAEDRILEIGESLSGNEAILEQFREVFIIATTAFVLCSLLAGWYMARRALSGVERVTRAAHQIAAGDWDYRVPTSRNQDEVDDLAAAFNTMVDRIQRLFGELRDVTDDIAHDLRTPLMRIRGEAEMALREYTGDAANQERYGSILEECDQMLRLINTMLEISQTEAGTRALACQPVALGAIVDDVCELFRPAAEDKGIQLRCTIESAEMLTGDEAGLRRAFAHLVDNAIKYTPSDGMIEVRYWSDGDGKCVAVRDTGIGIPNEAHEDVFKRYYRVEASRTAPGNGLGLSLARAIVRAHGGDIRLQSEAGAGATFIIRLD